MKKTFFNLIFLLLTVNIYSQTFNHKTKVKLTNIYLAEKTDSILAIKPSGEVVKSDVSLSDIKKITPNLEDLIIINDTLSFNNRDNDLGLGYKILRPDFDFSNIPLDYNNSIWEIRYIFDLSGLNIVLPENVTLYFNGGKIENYGNFVFNNTKIIADRSAIFDISGSLGGVIKNSIIYADWFGVLNNTNAQDILNFLSLNFSSFFISKDLSLDIESVDIVNETHIYSDGATINKIPGINPIFDISSNNVSIDGLKINSNDITSRSIQFDSGIDSLSFTNNYFYNIPSDSNLIYGVSGSNKASKIEIKNNKFYTPSIRENSNAIIIYNPESTIIEGNEFINSGGISIVYNQPIYYNELIVKNNRFKAVQNGNITIRPSNNATVKSVNVEGNYFEDSSIITNKYCINVHETIGDVSSIFESVNILNNSGNVNGSGAIKVGENGSNLAKTINCIISNNNFTNFNSLGEPIKNLSSKGLRVSGKGNFSISNNHFTGFGGPGIELVSENAIITNNIVNNCVQFNDDLEAREAGIMIEYPGFFNSENFIISNNISKNNGSTNLTDIAIAGIGFDRESNIKNILITGNICYDDRPVKFQQYGIRLGESGSFASQPENIIIKDNVLINNAVAPIINFNSGTDNNYIYKDNIVEDALGYSVFETNETRPDVSKGSYLYYTNNTSPTLLNRLENGFFGQKVIVYFQDDNTVIDFTGASAKFEGMPENWAAKTGDWAEFYQLGQGIWKVVTHRLIDYESTTGWADYSDTTYTLGSPFSVLANTDTKLPNNAGTIIDSQKPSDVTTFYDNVSETITGRNGDGITITVDFKATPTNANTEFLEIWLDITGGTGTPSNLSNLYRRIVTFPKGNGIERPINFTVTCYTLATWEANGAEVYVRANNTVDIYDIRYVVTRTHKAR